MEDIRNLESRGSSVIGLFDNLRSWELARRVLPRRRPEPFPIPRARGLGEVGRIVGGRGVRKNKVTAALGYDWMLERRHVNMTREQALRQIRSDYLELPDLTLTPAQAARLWSLREETAASLLEELASRRFLTRAKGSYMRRLRTERRF
jgi:hypothetical protein